MDKHINETLDRVTDDIWAQVHAIPDDFEPLGKHKLSRKEQIERYTEMRDDPEKWLGLLNEHGLVDTVQYAKKMEALYAYANESSNRSGSDSADDSDAVAGNSGGAEYVGGPNPVPPGAAVV